MADPEAGNADQASPIQGCSSLVSPSLTGGLQAVRRHLSISHHQQPPPVPLPFSAPAVSTEQRAPSAGGMLQLPHLFWNHLSNTGAGLSSNEMDMFTAGTIPDSGIQGMGGNDLDSSWNTSSSGAGGTGFADNWVDWSSPPIPTQPLSSAVDQTAISAALINFMADMAKSG